MEKRFFTKITEVNADLGLILGFAMICKEGGEEYVDLQDDHIPEHSMIESAIDFMESSRELRTMHTEKKSGEVVFAFPLTAQIAKAYGFETNKTGLMIGVRPDSVTLERAKKGEFTGFSIGGIVLESEYVDEQT